MTLGASYAYTYTKIPPTANPFLNNALTQVFVVYTPRNAASAYVDYEMPLPGSQAKVRLHLDTNYAGPAYSFRTRRRAPTRPSWSAAASRSPTSR